MKLVKVKMDPVKEEEIVHECYHHGRVIGPEDPNRKGFPPNQGCLMLPANAYYTVDEKAPELRVVGFTLGRTSYEWTEPKP